MKTKKTIEKEISEIISESEIKIKELIIDKSFRKKLKLIEDKRNEKISELRKFIRYIETCPSEEHVKSEIKRIEKLIEAKGDSKEAKKIYPVISWKLHLKTLKYILAD